MSRLSVPCSWASVLAAWRATALAVLFVVAPGVNASEEPPAPTWPEPATAERATLDELVETHQVVTAAGRPGLMSYVRDFFLYVMRQIAEWIDSFWGRWSTATGVLATVVAYAVLALAVSVVVIVLLRTLRRGRKQQGDGAHELEETVAAPRLAPAAEALDARFEALLAAGDVGAALAALWAWLAAILVGPSADPAWTSRELALAAGRRDLLPTVRHFDRLLYGPSTPSAADVRQLRSTLDGALRPPGVESLVEGGA